MTLTEADVDKIARLARLKPTAEEKRKLLEDLNKILEYMRVIDEIDVSGVDEMSHAAHLPTPFREDIVEQGLTADDALRNAPQAKDGYIVVPKVIDLDHSET